MKVKKEEKRVIEAPTAITRYRKNQTRVFNEEENVEKIKNLILEHKDVSKERPRPKKEPVVAEVLAEDVPEEEEAQMDFESEAIQDDQLEEIKQNAKQIKPIIVPVLGKFLSKNSFNE